VRQVDSIQKDAIRAVRGFLLGAGLKYNDYLTMDLQTGPSVVCSVVVSAMGTIQPTGGGSEEWNKWTLGSFLAKVDQALVRWNHQQQKVREDDETLRGQIERVKAKTEQGFDVSYGDRDAGYVTAHNMTIAERFPWLKSTLTPTNGLRAIFGRLRGR